MDNNLFEAGLVFGVIFLLIGISVAPSITAISYNSLVQTKPHSFVKVKSIVSKYQPYQIINKIKSGQLIYNNSILPITKIDDAFHGPTPYPSMEWWYFDSIFENEYSVHIGFRILSFQNFQMLKPTINIYYKSDLIANESTIISQKNFFTSETIPLLKIENKPVMLLDQLNNTDKNHWSYQVTYNINDVGVDLIFTGVTEGWKYVTLHEGWTVALPQASVKGNIFFDNEIIPVTGKGYHDHNWNFGLKTPARGWSWYWGKITSEHFSFSWANIKKTGILKQTFSEKLGILNTVQGSFDVIDIENIFISADSFIIKNGRRIPTRFHIYAKQDDLLINVTMETTSVHRTAPAALTMHYWRYFVTISGIIKKGDVVDHLNNNIHIMEYMRFI